MSTLEGSGSSAPAEAGTMRVAIYTRTACQSAPWEASAIDLQRAFCERALATHAASSLRLLPERYDDDGWSGLTLDRPALQRLLADVEAGHIDVVLVPRLDRLGRDLDLVREIETRLRRAGAIMLFVEGGRMLEVGASLDVWLRIVGAAVRGVTPAPDGEGRPTSEGGSRREESRS